MKVLSNDLGNLPFNESWTKRQLSKVIWSLTFRISRDLNLGLVWAIKPAVVIIRTAFFWILNILSVSPRFGLHNLNVKKTAWFGLHNLNVKRRQHDRLQFVGW